MNTLLSQKRKIVVLNVVVFVLLTAAVRGQNGPQKQLVFSGVISETQCREFPSADFDLGPAGDRWKSKDLLNVRCGWKGHSPLALTLTFTFDVNLPSGSKGVLGEVFRFYWGKSIKAPLHAFDGQFTHNPDLCSRLAGMLNSKILRFVPEDSAPVRRDPEFSSSCEGEDVWGTVLEIELTADFVDSALIAPIRTQQAQAGDYMLDDSVGSIALYSGLLYRSYVAPEYVVQSLEDLERRAGQLPPGTKLVWNPCRRNASGKPILFSDGQYDHFAKFCRDHKIEILISHSQPSNEKWD
jgi:hypothetical protein